MMIIKDDIINDIKRKLDAAGLNVSSTIVKLIIDHEHELIRDYLLAKDRVVFEGSFTAEAKKIKHRGAPKNPIHGTTFKIDADIDSDLKQRLMFRYSDAD